MKGLIPLASLLLLLAATNSNAQSIVCENKFNFDNPTVIANRVCPLGYTKIGEVNGGSNSRGIAGGATQIYQDMINRNEADRQARLARQAAAAEAQRQRDFLADEAKKQREYEQRQRQAISKQAKPQTEVVGKNLANAPKGTLIELICGTSTVKNHQFIFSTGSNKATIISKNVGNSNMGMSSTEKSDVNYEDTDSAFIFKWELRGRSEYSGKNFSDYYEYEINKLSKYASVKNTTQLEGRKPFDFFGGNQACRLSNYAEPASVLDSNKSRGMSLADGLKSLSDLYNQGLLTEEEFNAAKRRLLGL